MRRSFKIKEKYVIVIVTIVLLITIILTAGKRYNITFIEKGLGYIVMPVQKTFSSVGNGSAIRYILSKILKNLKSKILSWLKGG